MDKRQELQENITKLDTMIASLTGVAGKEERLQTATKKRGELQAELDALGGGEGNVLPTPELPAVEEGDAVSAILASMAHLMKSGGDGADSFAVHKMIEDALAERKISLSELDESVLEEIRKNQRVVLELPQYNLTIQMDKDDTKIPNIYEMIDDTLAGNNIYLIGAAGSGKAQPLYSKIATPNGWVAMGDIKVGDSVFSANGEVTIVDAVHDRGVRSIYRVHFQDGTYADCCDEHLWAVISNNHKAKGKDFEIRALKDFKNNLKRSNNTAYNWQIPIAKAVKYKPVKHLIHPYILGVLIGDGGLTQENVTITTPDIFIVEKVKSLLPDMVELNKVATRDRCDSYIIRMKDKKKTIVNPVKEELKRLGLMHKMSIHKFIPDEYMYDSIENRQELLLGLNDTDGSCGENKPTFIEYSTSSEALANDYVELLQSLGGLCNINSRIPKFKDKNGNKKDGHISFRLTPKATSDIQMFSLPKKKKNFQHQTKYLPVRTIVDVEYLDKMPCKCISIKDSSHLYLTDNYIVTHNTYISQLLCKILKRELTVINCSQYTSPTEIIGGQTIEGYKDGKLVLAWQKGKMLLLDEMPKLDPNTAGLLNDALSKSSKTIPDNQQFINSANPDQPPIERAANFSVIATGNIYPNTNDTRRYVGNNQQDLSLLDRFSGSVYYVDYDSYIDQKSCRYNFLYEMLVGNYYTYMEAKKEGTGVPEPKGLRTVLEATNANNYALTSYRTLIAFRVAFEYMLVRALANKGKPKSEQVNINRGKTVLKAWHSYLVAFDETAKKTLLEKTKFTDAYITRITNEAIDMIVNGGLEGFTKALSPDIRANAAKAFEESQSWIAADKLVEVG